MCPELGDYFHTQLTNDTGPEAGSEAGPCESYLCVEAARCLQEQRQVGLHLAAVGVGSVLGLALQRGDLVLKGVIPPAATQKTSTPQPPALSSSGWSG